ncbi:MAG: adenylate/guanylate cyclase domain-containing protein [Treponema berlinense]|nr:adenylate/guanylate cyclase domain-containing protein [Treponema berlinense]
MSRKQFFQKVGQTRIVPISLKIVAVFTVLLLLSNFTTNTINLLLSQKQIINLNNTIMVSRLKDLYSAAGNQYQIFSFNGERQTCIEALKSVSKKGFDFPKSFAAAIDRQGNILFEVYADGTETDEQKIFHSQLEDAQKPENVNSGETEQQEKKDYGFFDKDALARINSDYENGIFDGSLNFETEKGSYFGVYKYQEDWQCYFIRGESRADTNHSTFVVLAVISLIIFILLVAFLIIGFKVFGKILANVKKITSSLYQMQQNQKLEIIDLSSSPNDDITYLAASFNSLSSTINNLLGIFQKFVSKDVVAKAYNEHQIRLEGKRRNLTILFSDIKSFTYRTETLGNDIIDLLNVHYDRVIHAVHENHGVIGSIIGDAILAIYGTASSKKKSFETVESAWNITRLTAQLREKMILRRTEIEKERTLTEAEDRVFKAVLIDVGVGIDGGNVFYGNIGSDEHMTNTVIGDNVNSASRLEGLTRIYHLPVICSEYVKNEVEKFSDKYTFYEIDTVQVKGKTEGKKYFSL